MNARAAVNLSVRSTSSVAVAAETSSMEEQAHEIAARLGLPLITTSASETGFELLLHVTARGLSLVPADGTLGKGIRIDFTRAPNSYQRLSVGSTRQPLAKAVGVRHGNRRVIDATAGVGRDAFHLACLSCQVQAMERSTILSLMLKDAFDRALRARDPKLTAIIERLDVVSGDSRSMLLSLPADDRPDVVYLDPMYTPRESSALAKKEMRILRKLVGGDEDAGELLRIARETATRRVVVKRHLRAPPLAEDVSVSYPGQAVRYDVYLTLAATN
jgi:16S rRNA (guanine1516-N2)-methyltransferase